MEQRTREGRKTLVHKAQALRYLLAGLDTPFPGAADYPVQQIHHIQWKLREKMRIAAGRRHKRLEKQTCAFRRRWLPAITPESQTFHACTLFVKESVYHYLLLFELCCASLLSVEYMLAAESTVVRRFCVGGECTELGPKIFIRN